MMLFNTKFFEDEQDIKTLKVGDQVAGPTIGKAIPERVLWKVIRSEEKNDGWLVELAGFWYNTQLLKCVVKEQNGKRFVVEVG